MDKNLENLLNKEDNYFIHYASNGFYNGSSPAPKIACIVVYNEKNKIKGKFSISDYINENSIENSEKLLFIKFKNFLMEHPNISFIHWNMLADGFGFKAMYKRASEIEVELPKISRENLFDLASYIEYLAGKKLSIKQILWFNSVLDENFLDGKTEAQYFNQNKFEEILNSVHSKVVGLACIVSYIKDNSLKTEKTFKSQVDCLTKEERQELDKKIIKSRNKILNDIVKHNRNILDNIKQDNEENSYNFCLLDFNHPIISMIANWFGNKK
jgi:hypothetical protein